MKNNLLFLLLIVLSSSIQGPRTHLINLQFIANVDGEKILSSVDGIVSTDIKVNRPIQQDLLGFGKKRPKISSDTVHSTNPELAKLWNNTLMVFGAAPDGVGIGTTFAIKKISENRMAFITNYHVVEKFCETPEDSIVEIAEPESFKYPCHALFVLHDVLINTKLNTAAPDGAHPFKSEIMSLDYFDKKKDLAVFQVELPLNHNLDTVLLESNYDLKTLFVLPREATKINTQLLPDIVDSVKVYPLTAFNLYALGYSITAETSQIKKLWFKGTTEGINTFENDKKLGFIPALKHTIEVHPGTSGAPIALSDGRVIGINSSVEIKEFYAYRGFLFWRKKRLETYKSFFAMPTTFLNDFFDKLK